MKTLIVIGSIFLSFIAVSQTVDSYEAALSAAKSEEKKVLLVFTAPWCSPCQKMKKTVLTDSEVVPILSEGFVLYYVDIETTEGKEIQAKYRVFKGIPEIFIITHQEQILNRHRGALKKEEFLAFLAQPSPISDTTNSRPKAVNRLFLFYGLEDKEQRQEMQIVLRNPSVQQKIEERNFVIQEINLTNTIYANWLQKKNNTEKTPIILTINKYNNPLSRTVGPVEPMELMQLLDVDTTMIDFSLYKNPVTLKKWTRLDKFVAKSFNLSTQWRLGINIGINTTQIHNSNSENYKIGYEYGLVADYTPRKWKNNFVFQTGLILNSVGGQNQATSNNVRLNYLEIPFRLNYRLFDQTLTGCPQPVRLSIAPYWSYRVGDKNLDTATELSSSDKQDYGVKVGVNIATGALETFLGYRNGLKDIGTSKVKSYTNRGFFLTTTLVLGK